MKKAILYVEIEYDEQITDDESVAGALDHLLDTTKSSPGILDEYGDVDVGAFYCLDGPVEGMAEMVEVHSPLGAKLVRNFMKALFKSW